MHLTWSLIVIVATAFLFDFYNGMKDAANSVATIVSTRVLKPWQAVVWAAFFNFVAAFGSIFFLKFFPFLPFLSNMFSMHVANTIGTGIVDSSVVDPVLIFSSLVGAILWTLYCIRNGLPISVSHALVGGFIGTGLVKAGFKCLVMSGITKIVAFMVIAPIVGLILGLLIMVAVYWIARNQYPARIDKVFRRLQLFSAAAYSLGHGTNDAQKTMGIIAVLLFTTPGTAYYPYYQLHHSLYIPFWIIITCHFMMGMGTAAGGWHVIKTLGQRVTKLVPVQGFCAETGGAISLFIASTFGAPVSTTHVITGSICGVGATQRINAVRWGVAREIVIAWVITFPASAIMAALTYYIILFLSRFV